MLTTLIVTARIEGVTRMRSNEKKVSDGCRERALIEVEVF
jgi:hypothetical protein